FLERSWAAYMNAIGLPIDLRLDRVGFYPRGGGKIHARIGTASLRPLHAETTLTAATAIIHAGVAGLPQHVGDRLKKPATDRVATVSSHLLTNADVIHRFVERRITTDADLVAIT